MILSALRGALGFLTRLPVGRNERDFEAFQSFPAAFPLSGYVVGSLVAVAVLLPVPAPTTAFALVVAVVLVTGVNHADGLADLGDAAVVHGEPARRRDVMTDTAVGVGAVLALGVGLAGLVLAGLALAALRIGAAVGVVVASEVGAKLAMATLVCRGTPSHDGFGAAFLRQSDDGDLGMAVAVTIPTVLLAGLLAYPFGSRRGVLAAIAALLAAVGVALVVERWAEARLGGIGGDALGATNDLARIAALHAGVILWTLS